MAFIKYCYELQIRETESDRDFKPIGTPVVSDKRIRAEKRLRLLHPDYFKPGRVAAWRVVSIGPAKDQKQTAKDSYSPHRTTV